MKISCYASKFKDNNKKYLKNKHIVSDIDTLWQIIQVMDCNFFVKLEFLHHTKNIIRP